MKTTTFEEKKHRILNLEAAGPSENRKAFVNILCPDSWFSSFLLKSQDTFWQVSVLEQIAIFSILITNMVHIEEMVSQETLEISRP